MRLRIFIALLSLLSAVQAQEYAANPKLVVGVVVDQMRYDYISRFYSRFGDDGFKRLLNEGFECRNHHYNYMPTYTGPGHASIYTGTTPANHGIIANDWYDKFKKKSVYCASDDKVVPLGTTSEKEKMSPRRMLAMSFADANRLHTQFQGKTIGISIKDRGAILPAGHTANRAYWFRGKKEGKWVSSDFYGPSLPTWVRKINQTEPGKQYLKAWNPLYPINTYEASGADSNDYEKGFKGREIATLPYDLESLSDQNGGYDIIKVSPHGNSLVTDFAIEAIKKEKLGIDKYTDVLTISYSSPDYIGHNFGVNSVEIEDTYLRLDKELAKLLEVLDVNIGAGNYSLFLTADHGAVHVPSFLNKKRIPSGYIDGSDLKKRIQKMLNEKFKVDGLMSNFSNQQLFLNSEALENHDIDKEDVQEALVHFLEAQPEIQYAFTREQLSSRSMTDPMALLVQNGFHQRLSGDVAMIFKPSSIMYPKKGSTHGSPQVYDTHVPLIFYGKGVRKGKTYQKTAVIDIAPTMCAIMGIANPNGVTGEVIGEVIE